MKKFLTIVFLCWALLTSGQPIEQYQFWGGIMTNYRIGEKSLIWNDSHYVPNAFFIIRTGYTHETKAGRFTVGLAHLWLPDGEGSMSRDEWRPWGQWFLSRPINPNWQYQFRIRYEARFREEIMDGKVVSNEFGFNNRARFQANLRRNIWQVTAKDKLFVAIGGEILFNQGNNVHWMDQHRRNITVGIARKGINFQTGYMNRQNFNNSGFKTQINHTWINWLILEF